MNDGEYRYRMSEAKRRVRNGIRAGATYPRKTRRKMISTWLLIAGIIVVMLVVRSCSLV